MENANTNVKSLQTDVKKLNAKVEEYDQTIQQYSDMCDGITGNNNDFDKRLSRRFRIDHIRPRPIVVKFTYYKEKEMIKQAGHEKLPNSDYCVKDQYQKEMEDKRRPLYQIADELRKNKDNKVVLQPDNVTKGDTNNRTGTGNQDRSNGNQTSNNRQRINTQAVDENHWSRTFYRRQNQQKQIENTGITVQNKFNALSTPTIGETSTRFSKHAVKKKATSPLDSENLFKKQHYCVSSNSESDNHNTDSNIYPSQEPTTSPMHTEAMEPPNQISDHTPAVSTPAPPNNCVSKIDENTVVQN
ncbi:hypothetical protein DPMN_016928 [Dreissena polymorpha]|uniref:Uncharacterized protein n=1 Tax=Dreissena polymorpha TaxID=45954 RepID=A0A9D4S6Z2_DREPO|nr:hypothetical protein DPMN_016928 [Dreissena polymorpha]